MPFVRLHLRRDCSLEGIIWRRVSPPKLARQSQPSLLIDPDETRLPGLLGIPLFSKYPFPCVGFCTALIEAARNQPVLRCLVILKTAKRNCTSHDVFSQMNGSNGGRSRVLTGWGPRRPPTFGGVIGVRRKGNLQKAVRSWRAACVGLHAFRRPLKRSVEGEG